MKYTITCLFALLLFFNMCKSPESKATIEEVTTKNVIDDAAIASIDSTLRSYVESGTLAGVSALVFEKNKEVYFNAFGHADREKNLPMDRNTLVQIYSMTKPITGTALMTLFEQGKFKLDDPVALYAPEFADLQVYAGMDSTTGKMILEAPQKKLTIRDLTRHTAGFGNRADIPGLSEVIAQTDAMNRENTLAQMAEKLGSIPLWFHPGAQWEYGPSVDVQAFLVERISGQLYGEYVRAHVLDPLGMAETRYVVPEQDHNRLSAVYRRDGNDVLNREPDEVAHAFNTMQWPLTPGGFGLTSTVDDYMRFARMLVNEGTLEDVSILKPETIKLMSTNHLPDSIKVRAWLPGKGQVGFGIDFAVRLRPPLDEKENYGVVGEFFWDGAASTLFWVDPVNELTAVLFVQLFPYDGVGLHKNFRDAVYSSYKSR